MTLIAFLPLFILLSRYDGGLFVSLHRDDNPVISEPYPPGTRVLDTKSPTGPTLAGTVMDIPFDSTTSPQYLVIFNDGTSRVVPASDMPSLIPKPPQCLRIQRISCRHFFSRDAKSLTNTKVPCTKDSSANLQTAYFGSASNHISTRSQKTGGFHFLISHLLGKFCALKAPSFQAINCHRSSDPHLRAMDRLPT